ncbi:Septin-domain-containing protein [Phlyctochytrium arcticum]|nr:Septin-domain-containing protein [Phlyctochytrium arcticum]
MAMNWGSLLEIGWCLCTRWVLAKNELTAAVGLVPRNFLQAINSNNAPVAASTGTFDRNGSKAPSRTASLIVTERRQSRQPQQLQQMRAKAAAPVALSLTDLKRKKSELEVGRRNRARAPIDIGKLKVSVVGDSGIGKSTLLFELLKQSEITAADPPAPKDSIEPTPLMIQEYYASTVPGSIFSTSDEDKYNLSFIDSPGYGASTDALAIIHPVVSYHVSQFAQTDQIFTREATPNQLIRFLTANTGGHSHVDASIYCILHRITQVDLEYMRRLSKTTCVIPILIRSDTLGMDESFAAKKEIVDALSRSGVEFFGFGFSNEELIALADAKIRGSPPYAISAKYMKRKGEFGKSDVSGSELDGGRFLNEFDTFKESLLFLYLDEIRRITADKFVRWRSQGSAKEID